MKKNICGIILCCLVLGGCANGQRQIPDTQSVSMNQTEDEHFKGLEKGEDSYAENQNVDITTISDKNPVWALYYGEWVIYTEFDNESQVMAYNLKTEEKVQLLEYGFSSALHGDELIYQEKKKGYINKLNLCTGEDSLLLKEWGQSFCYIGQKLYFINGNRIREYVEGKKATTIYEALEDQQVIDQIYVEEDQLYFKQREAEESHVYRIHPTTGTVEVVQ